MTKKVSNYSHGELKFTIGLIMRNGLNLSTSHLNLDFICESFFFFFLIYQTHCNWVKVLSN
jgi:hypothetical protein